MKVKGYITLKTIFGGRESARMINLRYLIIDTHSSYNMIIGLSAFNQLGASLSILYICMKYPLSDGRVGFI